MNNTGASEPSNFETQALSAIFGELSDRKIRYAVLRNYECLPESVAGNDIDIIVHPEDLNTVIHIIAEVARFLGAAYAKFYHDDMITQLVIVKRQDIRNIFPVKIDLLHNRQILGVEFLDTDAMLANLRTHNGIPVVSERVMLLDKWSFHLLLGYPLPEKYNDSFARIARREASSLIRSLSCFLPKVRATELVAALADGRGASLVLTSKERRNALMQLWAAQGLIALPRSLRFARYRIRDILKPQGIFVSFSGPDGSGKTTVIEMVISQLAAIYGASAIHYAHFRPTMLPRIAEVAKKARAVDMIDKDYDRPHRAKPSGFVGSAARLVYYWLDYMGGYFRSVFPVLRRREIMLFDRYYYDMIADSYRSRISLPMPLLRMMGRVLPLPEYAFFIQVAPEAIYRRKQELTLQRIVELNDRYSVLVKLGWLFPVDNNAEPEQAAAAIIDHIVADRHSRVLLDMKIGDKK
ncbi:hypothetical protein [Gemmobacter sp.]|uniref:hypothetical protein n=1 Tax=Gemmobacter sp. TaxID=1898957 RepID=UPI002AFDCE6B|nr:hypothetical protein [Gemmobacter sp.]